MDAVHFLRVIWFVIFGERLNFTIRTDKEGAGISDICSSDIIDLLSFLFSNYAKHSCRSILALVYTLEELSIYHCGLEVLGTPVTSVSIVHSKKALVFMLR